METNTINTVTDEQTQVSIIFDELKKWIAQRSKLDFADYGDRTAYGQDSRQVQADGRRARAALAEARSLQPARLGVLLDSFRAFSGRLTWVPEPTNSIGVSTGLEPAHLEYCTGQYWPTEYRKAAASVLETYIAGWKQAEAAANPKTFTYTTMDDVQVANRAIGNHWFDRSTMRFFKTRIESRLIAGHRFVTSEQGPDGRRRYSIRDAQPDGTIDTVGEFQGYGSKKAAMVDILKVKA